VLPTGDPAGTIATCTAGRVEFSATLCWDTIAQMPPRTTLPPLPECARCSVVETDDPAGHTRAIRGEILALSATDLGSVLETVLRSLTITAALSDAVLETRATRTEAPVATPSSTLQALARDLWEAGFGVTFAPSWMPVPVGAVGLGVHGAERELDGFLRAHPSWTPI
jgi:hypothetical protein